MLFNSFEFLVFFIALVIVYFSINSKYRWMLLLAASYYFYMSWKAEYILLILFTTAVSYFCSIWMQSAETLPKRRRILIFSLVVNLGVLFFFKYFNFLYDGVRDVLSSYSIQYEYAGLDILLPLGISFYTFQTIGYNLDVFYQVRKPEKHFGIFALYVSFFPQLIAGPIERSTELLPQFYKEHKYDSQRIFNGIKYIIWGLFKKLVIADRLVPSVNEAFSHTEMYSGSTMLFASLLFAIQLYADFSAYSEIAKGLAKILGYKLMDNFNHPFISKNITEFWRRWHISLSFWLRDYLYTPILFSKKKWGKWAIVYSLLITFTLVGIWHGTRINFVILGLLQAVALIFEMFTKKFRKKLSKAMPKGIYNRLSMIITLIYILYSFSFFKAKTFQDSLNISKSLFSSLFDYLNLKNFILNMGYERFLFTLLLVLVFILSDQWIFKKVKEEKSSLANSLILFPFLIACTFIFGYFGEVEFIYFQF
jgi:alginate O-acetyltransferase complex protein AlgI